MDERAISDLAVRLCSTDSNAEQDSTFGAVLVPWLTATSDFIKHGIECLYAPGEPITPPDPI